MNKITGTYKDNQGFYHVVFYNRREKKYDKLIYSPRWNYCSSTRYTKEQIRREVSGMKRVES